TADFNGDGKTDLLTRSNSGLWEVAYSNGKSFVVQPFNFHHSYNEMCSYSCGSWPYKTSGTIPGDRIYISDFNGDGKSDIVHYQVSCPCSGWFSTFNIYFSKGSEFFYTGSEDAPDISSNIRIITDVNGDGKAEISYRDGSHGAGAHLQTYYFKPFTKENFLGKVKDGHGRVT